MNYKEQIKSPKWQKKRLEVLELRGFKCEECKCEDKQLHVHHRFYIKGRKYWEYDNDVLQVLCEDCHQKEHEKPEEIDAYKAGKLFLSCLPKGKQDFDTAKDALDLFKEIPRLDYYIGYILPNKMGSLELLKLIIDREVNADEYEIRFTISEAEKKRGKLNKTELSM